MPPKTPVVWVKYEPYRALVASVGLSPGAELAHRRLCDHHWTTQRWTPRRGSQILEVTRASEESLPGILRELGGIGWRGLGARLVNAEVAQIASAAAAAHVTASARGRTAAQYRWGQHEFRPAPERACAKPSTSMPQASAPGNADASAEHNASNAPPVQRLCHDKKRREEKILSVKRERLTFSASAQKEQAPGETEFFEELERVLQTTGARQAALELTNWGGWWRNRFRAEPDKARRVLADVHSMLKEGRVRKNAGAAAVDLWARLPG